MLKDKRIKKYCKKVIATTNEVVDRDKISCNNIVYKFDNLYILFAFTKIFKIELGAYPTQKFDSFVYIKPAYKKLVPQETTVSFKDFLFNRFNLNNIDKLSDLYQKSMFDPKNYYKLATVEHYRGLVIVGWIVFHQMMYSICNNLYSDDANDN